MADLDLLDLLAASDEPAVMHALMPDMALACGRDLLTVYKASGVDNVKRVSLTMSKTTCPACLAGGDLSARCARMCRRQREVVE